MSSKRKSSNKNKKKYKKKEANGQETVTYCQQRNAMPWQHYISSWTERKGNPYAFLEEFNEPAPESSLYKLPHVAKRTDEVFGAGHRAKMIRNPLARTMIQI